MSVGWRLAEEIAWARPERPGPEWWTLLDIAQDARDETRQSMPGHDYLMARGKCSRATLYRRLKALTNAGLLAVARRPAPGVRAVYEIPVIHTQLITGLMHGETRSRLTSGETRSGSTGLRNRSNRSQEAFETGLTIADAHPVTTTSSLHPSPLKEPPVDSNLEGTGLSTGEPSGNQDHLTRLAASTLREH